VTIDDLENRAVITVEELAELLALGRSATYAAIGRGELPSLRIGRRLVIPAAAVRRLLALDEPAYDEGAPHHKGASDNSFASVASKREGHRDDT